VKEGESDNNSSSRLVPLGEVGVCSTGGSHEVPADESSAESADALSGSADEEGLATAPVVDGVEPVVLN
jgi:hypothetical protein